MLQSLSLAKWFFIQISIVMTIFHYINVGMHNISKVDELQVSWGDSTCKLIMRIVIREVTTMTLNTV